jgi:hypothetical protein
MGQSLKLVAALLGIFSIAPLSILLATGSPRQALQCAREYGLWVLVVCLVPAAIGWFTG